MTNDELELIRQTLSTVGGVGAKGFAYLVYYTLTSSIIYIAGNIAIVTFATWLLRRAFSWKPDDDGAWIFRGVGIVVLAIVIIISVCCMFDAIAGAIAPEGAAIKSLLGAAQ
jgi:hypothetical protein